MRVLVVCDWFLKYAVSQASALRRAGAEVTLLTRNHAGEFGGSQDERAAILRELEDGIPVWILSGRISSPGATSSIVRLRRAVRKWRPDIVHTHDNADPRLHMIVAGFPRVTTLHDPAPHPGQPSLPRIQEALRRRFIRGSTAVVVHGHALVDALPSWGDSLRVAVIPHGAAIREVPLPPPVRPAVLLFGRLEPYKGIQVLLEAMNRVWIDRPDIRLIVAGNGPEASTVPADPRIELRLEYIPEAELDALFGEATLSVLPYVEASQSGVGTFSLGRGVPTIVSNTGALSEIAFDPSFLVPAGDEVALAEAIIHHLRQDVGLRDEVLEFARSRFSWDVCARRSLELYDSLVPAGGS